jgi:UDP-N-acetylmuramate dehydrogenase
MSCHIQHNVSLKAFNTFGLDVRASVFCEVDNLLDLKQILSETDQNQVLFLGGGSNVLFCNDYNGLVIHNAIKGIQVVSETETEIILKAYSGELWHDLVMHCVEQGWGGIENMSLIPGTLGAAPMQNIGAYGVELEQVFVELEALNLQTFELETFLHEHCQFGYRESVFKRHLKGQYFIYSVTIRLSKQPQINVSYGDILTLLNTKGIDATMASIKDVANAVIAIRSEKLPDPKVLGNSGSFFKNPTVSIEHLMALRFLLLG